jgi:type II secretory ATPase GspE/PulE/Tfp pilus assembly ATPase PilB-like protein
MLDDLLPEFFDLDRLPDEQQRQVMYVKKDAVSGPIENFMRRVFVWAIVSGSSDVHIEGRGDSNKPHVYIHVRTPKGMVNMLYTGDQGKYFETKMFSLTGTPQGGSTPFAVSTRFSITLPASYAIDRGLKPRSGENYEVDIRVEYVKTFDSFSFVSRLLDQQKAPGLDDLRLPSTLLHSIKSAAAEPSGLILATGPTGSGKTTLLNAALGYLNDGQRSIITIENPVELRQRGPGPIKQYQVQGDFTFARGLRSALRQDPDVILVGEIRDEETMHIAIEASKTGHMVLSTLHANTAHESISRLIGMGADPVSVAETLKLVMAQRLLPRYEGTPQLRDLSRDEMNWLTLNGMAGMTSIYEVPSNEKCGKVAMIEAIRIDDAIKQLIRSPHFDATNVYRAARDQHQYESLASAGVRNVEALGCKLSDCMTGLESNTDAQLHPGLRIRLAAGYGLSLSDIAQALDTVHLARDDGEKTSLEQVLEGMRKDGQCVAV